MEFMQDTMTRKEYLKSKNKSKYNFRKIKYTLLIIVVILLGMYVFKQLKLYNSVTSAANKVIEQSALSKTLNIYYIEKPYTKEGKTSVVMYNSFDESRTKIKDSEGMTNIYTDGENLYGMIDSKLYYINATTMEKKLVLEDNISNYLVVGNSIYVYMTNRDDSSKTGLYILDNQTSKLKQIITGTIYQMISDDSYIYLVTAGKTNRSIIRYDLNGKSRLQLTGKEIVENIIQSDNNIYFTNKSEKGAIYSVGKNGKNITKITNNTCMTNDLSKNDFNADRIMGIVSGNLVYINSSDSGKLHVINLETKKDITVINKKIESISISKGIIYYKISGSLEIYKYNTYDGKNEKVTSIRGNSYICIN